MTLMLRRMLAVFLIATTSCIGIPSTGPSLTLVELGVTGSPTIEPGGPRIYVDDVYRGNPVGSSFRMWLSVGEHHVRIQGGSLLLWDDVIHVIRTQGTQDIRIEYDAAVLAANHPYKVPSRQGR